MRCTPSLCCEHHNLAPRTHRHRQRARALGARCAAQPLHAVMRSQALTCTSGFTPLRRACRGQGCARVSGSPSAPGRRVAATASTATARRSTSSAWACGSLWSSRRVEGRRSRAPPLLATAYSGRFASAGEVGGCGCGHSCYSAAAVLLCVTARMHPTITPPFAHHTCPSIGAAEPSHTQAHVARRTCASCLCLVHSGLSARGGGGSHLCTSCCCADRIRSPLVFIRGRPPIACCCVLCVFTQDVARLQMLQMQVGRAHARSRCCVHMRTHVVCEATRAWAHVSRVMHISAAQCGAGREAAGSGPLRGGM